MVNLTIYQHFRAEERPLVDEFMALIAQAQTEYRPILTHFLNPRERYIIQTLLGNSDELKLEARGGYLAAERKRMLIFPSYYEPQASDFEVTPLEISYPQKFAELSHGQILGTLANSGLNRNVIGDIITDGERWQVFTQTNMKDYFQSQIERIAKIKVKLVELDPAQVIEPLDEWQQASITVTSLRLDAIIASCYHISRQRAKELIKSRKVQLNWMLIEKADYTLDSYDIISVRGHGRIRLDEVLGTSKKGKLRLGVSILGK